MPRFSASVDINRPIAEVSAFVAEPKNWLKWESGLVVSEQTSDGPVGVGTTGHRVNQFMGRRIETTWEVTEYAPDVRAAFKSTSGDMSYTGSMQFDAVDGGTRFTYSIDGQLSGFFWRLLEPLVGMMGQRQFRSDLNRLKELLEAEASGSEA
jgi:uncharacterized membrane protein